MVAVRGDDDGFQRRILQLIEPVQKRQAIHLRHVDVGKHEADLRIDGDLRQRLHPVLSERKIVFVFPDLLPELLPDQDFEICFVVDNQNLV